METAPRESRTQDIYLELDKAGCVLNPVQERDISQSRVSSVIKFNHKGVIITLNSEPDSLLVAVKILDRTIPSFSKNNFLNAGDLINLTLGGNTVWLEPQNKEIDGMISLRSYAKFAQNLCGETVGYLGSKIGDEFVS